MEIDLIVQKSSIYPLEVKAEENLRSKSLKTVYDDNHELRPRRFSMAGYKKQEWMENVPLYLVGEYIAALEDNML